MTDSSAKTSNESVAVIGMAGRWPQARSVAEFWRNVRDGRDCISRFSISELDGVGASDCVGQPDFVTARSILEGVEDFDAEFFGVLPREARLMDPQHRVFLECCWEALEDAGCDPQSYAGAIGVFAGCSNNTYFLHNVCADRKAVEEYAGSYPLGDYATMLGAINDSLATRVAYKLNLRGPSLTIQTACSTSLVAICQACQSLLTYQSDMALAGGVSITIPQKRGYRYQEGAMGSADGRCRPFDANARGTVFGSGAGVVLLKRLEDALADGDPIRAVIRGFAVNNDGSGKVGYTAPSVEGQASVIAMAHAAADVDPESIAYLEAHGTATPLGDPIEFAALTRAFRARTQARNFCALGSVKANVGHLEAAAGVTGLINVIQAFNHEQLPPLAGFESPNPNIDIANSPFYINTQLAPWSRGARPRRAGVSSFGVGGTNAHIVLEEAPFVDFKRRPGPQILVLSARSATALDNVTNNLVAHLKAQSDVDLSSVAHTLRAGRRTFDHRRAVVCSNVDDAIRVLENRDKDRCHSHVCDGSGLNVVFMFPGQGSQYPGMAGGLYRTKPTFQKDVDHCAEILAPLLQCDLREKLFPDAGGSKNESLDLTQTALAQPALFVMEYALARLWMQWGIKPQCMIGHSIGEYVAACLAGVFTLEDALTIVATRGRMMQELPIGAMASVRLSEDQITPMLNGELSLAAANAPQLSVVSGPVSAIAKLEQSLGERGVAIRRLATSHAFHSGMMDPIVAPFIEFVSRFRLSPPQLPYISGVTGTWMTADDACDPRYWARHFREPVRFTHGIRLLKQQRDRVFLEVGPGRALSTLARQHRDSMAEVREIASLPESADKGSDEIFMLNAIGRLWLHGATPDWKAIFGENTQRCPLPTYPFERQRYWIDPPQPSANPVVATKTESCQTMTTDAPQPTMKISAPSRVERLRAALIDVFQERSGLSLSDCDPNASFLELGFDSLFLTQVTQSLQSRFGIRVTFRQLLEQQSSLNALAEHLDLNLPADALPVESNAESKPGADQAPSVAAVEALAPMNPSAIDAIIHAQLQTMSQLMSRQLEALRGSLTAAPVANEVVSTPKPITSSESASSNDFKPFGPYKPVRRGPVGGLSHVQANYLETFIQRYTKRTAKSKELTQLRRAVLADPRVVSGFRSQWKDLVYPIVTVRSRGSRLWDIDGNEYIDLLNGFGPILFGHSPDFVTEAISTQLSDGFEIGPQTPLAGEVAELVRELTGNERVTFCNTGSEAVMAALRVARTVSGRSKVVLFAGAYHGTFDEVLVKGVQKGGRPCSLPIAPGIPDESLTNVVVLEYGAPESLDYIRANANELAAVLVEPVQSRRPDFQPIEFLREIREITEVSGTALIFDEIVTGFRSHPGGAQALFGIRADLATYGKVAGGGMPIGILAGKGRFMDALDGGTWQYGDDSFPETGVTFFAGTFVRHPLALAASAAILKRLLREGPELQRTLTARTATLVQSLNDSLAERGVPIRIATFASWFHFSIPAELPNGSLLYYHLREKGIHIQDGFPCFITTAHSDADLAAVVTAFQQSVEEMQAGEFLPKRPQASGKPLGAALPIEFPPTEAQMEVWLAARISDEASCSFNESFTLELRGRLDRPALHTALQALVNRHDALRSTFDSVHDIISVRETVETEMPLIDLSSFSIDEQKIQVQRLIDEEARHPFDLGAGPLVRVKLVALAPQLHSLLFTTHHIVCDGWSTNVLIQELSQLYSAASSKSAAKLPEATPFQKYAEAQQVWRQSEERAAVEAWWLEQFKQPVTPLELPTDRPRKAMKSYRGGTSRHVISFDLYHQLKKFGAQQGCTLFATLLTGFTTLLHRLTGQDDIVVGIPAAGQSGFDGVNLVGHCVNFLPVRTLVNGDHSAANLLSQVRATLLDVFDHQNYTYGSLVQKLGLKRDPSRLPLVEVQFNLERVGEGLKFSDLDARVDTCPKSFVNFDLFLNVVESDDGLLIDCDFNRDLFDESTIERWLGHLETLLHGMIADPQCAVANLPILSETERHRILVEWNNTAADYPRDKCIHQLVTEQAVRTPDRIAAVCQGREMTYAQLEAQSNRLAGYLGNRGVGPGCRVAVIMERSLDMLVGLLGVLKTGAAYVPIDPEFPPQRVDTMLADADPASVLTHQNVLNRFRLHAYDVIDFETASKETSLHIGHPPKNRCSPEDTAYIIYTSGSTGAPKGVQIPHRAVVNLLTSMSNCPGIRAEDTLLAVTTIAFDIAVLELFLPLLVGARVVIATRADSGDGHALMALMRSANVTVMQATPATWRILLEAGWNKSTDLKVLCGGDALPRDLANLLLQRSDSVWNMYGPTETTIWSAVSKVEPGADAVTIGSPISNTQFYVLDENGNLVPPGVPGELYIGGDGVAIGYWRQPDQSRARFVFNPFRPPSSEKMYRTGDMVRARPNGVIEFLGRRDNQVKVRGFRIETAEVELILKQFPRLTDCVVIARADSPGEKQLVAYYTALPPLPSSHELRQFANSMLPAYMVPDIFVHLNAIPCTPNGKTDRHALPSPAAVRSQMIRELIPPRNPQEKLLAEICQSILQVGEVGIDDDLFELGLHSLQLFQILARANNAGLNISPKDIMLGRTVGAIVAAMTKDSATMQVAQDSDDQASAMPPLIARTRDHYRVPRANFSEVGDSNG